MPTRVDLDNSKLLAILPGRTQKIIKEVLNSWGEELLEQIEEVGIDLWRGYKSIVNELIPNAQVVADRFHVMTQIKREGVRERGSEREVISGGILPQPITNTPADGGVLTLLP